MLAAVNFVMYWTCAQCVESILGASIGKSSCFLMNKYHSVDSECRALYSGPSSTILLALAQGNLKGHILVLTHCALSP